MIDTLSQEQDFHVAVIGMAGRFPGANSLTEYWQNLSQAVESVRRFSPEELLARKVSPQRFEDAHFVPMGSTLLDTDRFAATFFGYAPHEAELMDPQHRILLECAWEAVEHAGYAPLSLPCQTGVFTGSSLSSYMLFNLLVDGTLGGSEDEFEAMIGCDKDFLSSRVSYKLNLRGPSIAVQSGCSTSLLAVHLAVQQLLAQQCDVALAGGVSVGVPQRTGHRYQPQGILSPDGHTRSFDAAAGGTLFGEGLGIVVLKRLRDALRDRDTVHAVIRGTAANNDGAAKLGFVAPSVDGQASVIASALALSGVSADSIGYVEAHGTATALGDPIEVAALTRAYRLTTQRRQFCALGSVKTNIGHLDAAAGIAGFLKTVLMLKHRQIAPSLHFSTPNPGINFAESPFYVSSRLHDWETGAVRRAGVSSFGIGGTNVHVVLEEGPRAEQRISEDAVRIVCLSAKTGAALEQVSDNLRNHLETDGDTSLSDLCYTLQVGREAFQYRRAVIASNSSEAIGRLRLRDPDEVFTALSQPQRTIGFMFPGGGAQYPGMGQDLYAEQPEFRAHMDQCFDLLREDDNPDFRQHLYPAPAEKAQAADALARPSIGLPALFATGYAMARLLMSYGLQPACMIGHSLGEYVAACIAGVFSLEDALSLVLCRGRIFESLPPGAMLSVSLPEVEAVAIMDGQLSVAAINSPNQCVVSGPVGAIAQLETVLASKGVECRRLHIDVAAHSAMVEPAKDELRDLLMSLTLKEPKIPLLSNVTGTWMHPNQARSPHYWVDHLRQPVRFADGIAEMLRDPNLLLIESGPSNSLAALARGQAKDRLLDIHSSMRHPRDARTEQESLSRTLARLWVRGANVDWSSVNRDESCRRVPLPSYPFERERYWINPEQATSKTTEVQDALVYAQCAMPAPMQTTSATERSGSSWILLVDEFGIGTALRELLIARDERVIALRAAQHYGSDQVGAFRVRPDDAHDLNCALRTLEHASAGACHIVHLWSLGRAKHGTTDLEEFRQAQETGSASILALLKAMELFQPAPALDLTLVTSGTVQVSGGDACDPSNRALAAFCAVLPHEMPGCRQRVLDVPSGELNLPAVLRIAAQIFAEIIHGAEVTAGAGPSATAGTEAVVAFRGVRRYVAGFKPILNTEKLPEGTPLREGGVYLITGGLGAVGPVIAEALARRTRCTLVLAARSVFPHRTEWNRWLQSHGEQDRNSLLIRRFQKIEQTGTEIVVYTVDITCTQQVNALIAQILEHFGRLDGVFHLAGLTGDGVLRLMSDLDVNEVFRQAAPKVEGSLALAAALRDWSMDFCVLFSSTASVLGGAGMASYAAANGFLDMFAAQQTLETGRRWISVGWDAWLDENSPIYMATRKTALDEFALPAAQAAEILLDLVARVPGGHYVVSSSGMEARQRSQTVARGQRSEIDVTQTTRHPRPSLVADFAAPASALEQQIAKVWGEVLGLDRIGLHDNLFELGGTSLIGLRIISRLKALLGVEIPAVALFEAPTVLALSRFVLAKGSQTTYSESKSRGDLRRRARAGMAQH